MTGSRRCPLRLIRETPSQDGYTAVPSDKERYDLWKVDLEKELYRIRPAVF
jgi:hypothetical protein